VSGGDSEPPTVGGILLAAGESTRFGEENKLLAVVDGEPVVRRAAAPLVTTLPSVVAVLGHEADRVRAALDPFDIETVRNDRYREGQSTSVAVGVDFAREHGWDAVVFGLGDMPFLEPETIEALVGAYRAGDDAVLFPTYEGKRGNPALFDRAHYDDLEAVEGDRGGREIGREQGVPVAVDDPGVRRDVDEPRDL
jgi:molybdenum cofactor cytidylyltransferase